MPIGVMEGNNHDVVGVPRRDMVTDDAIDDGSDFGTIGGDVTCGERCRNWEDTARFPEVTRTRLKKRTLLSFEVRPGRSDECRMTRLFERTGVTGNDRSLVDSSCPSSSFSSIASAMSILTGG